MLGESKGKLRRTFGTDYELFLVKLAYSSSAVYSVDGMLPAPPGPPPLLVYSAL